MTIDLSAAVIDRESRPLRLGLMECDYVAAHQVTLRRGSETIELLVRRPFASVVRAGLERGHDGVHDRRA